MKADAAWTSLARSQIARSDSLAVRAWDAPRMWPVDCCWAYWDFRLNREAGLAVFFRQSWLWLGLNYFERFTWIINDNGEIFVVVVSFHSPFSSSKLGFLVGFRPTTDGAAASRRLMCHRNFDSPLISGLSRIYRAGYSGSKAWESTRRPALRAHSHQNVKLFMCHIQNRVN